MKLSIQALTDEESRALMSISNGADPIEYYSNLVIAQLAGVVDQYNTNLKQQKIQEATPEIKDAFAKIADAPIEKQIAALAAVANALK